MCDSLSKINRFVSREPQRKDSNSKRFQISRRELISRATAIGLGLALAELISDDPTSNAFNLFPMPSVSDQKKAGQDAAKQVLQQYKLCNDSRANEIKSVGSKLVSNLREPDKSRWDYDFHLIDSKEINAFALPGGPLFFFTGLYDNMTTEDELAAVVGHEMTHVRLQHWAKAYQKQEQNDLFIGIAEAAGHVGNLGQQVLGFANQTWSLSYSRGEEAQADQGGLQDMVASGYNPQGMIDMFGVLLKKVGNGGSGFAGAYLSNHPLTTDRIKTAKSEIAAIDNVTTFTPQRPIGAAAGLTATPGVTDHSSASPTAQPSPPAQQNGKRVGTDM